MVRTRVTSEGERGHLVNEGKRKKKVRCAWEFSVPFR